MAKTRMFGEMKGQSAMRKPMRPKTYKKKAVSNPFTLPKDLKFPVKFRKYKGK